MDSTVRRLRPYVRRSPRLVLNASDNRIMRFSRDSETQSTFTTEIVNISESGISFTVDRALTPFLGEQIKLEFQVPGKGQIAWFARVVRVEFPEDLSGWRINLRTVRVAVRFENLPDGHVQTLRVGLREQFERLAFERKMQTYREIGLWIKRNAPKMLLYAVSTILVFSCLYFLSRPSANYGPGKHVPWGERFK